MCFSLRMSILRLSPTLELMGCNFSGERGDWSACMPHVSLIAPVMIGILFRTNLFLYYLYTYKMSVHVPVQMRDALVAA
jgi:hypothetical protein